jgi:hypothetical protein
MKRNYSSAKPPKSQFHNKAGNLTPYAFACGYVETYRNEKSRLTLSKERNDWHVKGFIDDVHTWESFTTLKQARDYCRRA